MEKPAITSHKSHMSCIARPAECSLHDRGEWHAGPPGHDAGAPRAEAGDDAGSDASGSPDCCRPPVTATVTRWAFLAACRVDASAWPRAGHPGRTAAETAGAARQAPSAERADRTVGTDRAAGASRTAPTRGGGIPHPARGARRGARQAARAAKHRQLGKGQVAYFAADETGAKSAARLPRLSRGESPIYAQDLLSATLSNLVCV